MFEFPPSLLSTSPSTSTNPTIPSILVDSRHACLAEAGELVSVPSDVGLVELGQVVDNEGKAVEGLEEKFGLRKHGRSLFKGVGVGGMDVGITELMVKLARELGVGTTVQF